MADLLNFKALAGYKPETLFPEDIYQAEIKKIHNSENGMTVIACITDYQGNKGEGLNAVGKEIVCYITTTITSETADFIKKQSQKLMFELCDACGADQNSELTSADFVGKLVLVAAGKRKDKYGDQQMSIVGFKHA